MFSRVNFTGSEQHHIPHIHAHYPNENAVLDITTGNVLEGNLRNTKLKLVQAWIEIHKEELWTDWELAIKAEPIFSIDPLR